MGRSNYAILAMGLASMLAMSLLMGYFLKAAKEKQSPIATELQAHFGHRLDEPGKAVVKGRPGERRCRITIHPILGGNHERLAREVGEFVWRRFGDELGIRAVTIACVRWGLDKEIEHEIARPYMPGHKASTPPTPTPQPAPAAGRTRGR